MGRTGWAQLAAVRAEVSRHLEQARKAGAIRSSLDAEVDLYCDEALQAALARAGDELRFLLITSAARIHPVAAAGSDATATEIDGLRLVAAAPAHTTSESCRHHRHDADTCEAHLALCGRCVENVEGAGEMRRFA